jgi:hypothetical protein
MIKLAAIVAILLVAGCSPRAVRVETVTVNVPVAVQCVDRSEYDKIIARFPLSLVFDKVAIIAARQATAQGLSWREIAKDLQAVMVGCLK